MLERCSETFLDPLCRASIPTLLISRNLAGFARHSLSTCIDNDAFMLSFTHLSGLCSGFWTVPPISSAIICT